MTKIGILSDLHLHHWASKALGEKLVASVRESIEQEKPDLVLDAGDYEVDWDTGLTVPVIKVRGNHDYYGKTWDGPAWDTGVETVAGLKVAWATLWTDFNGHNTVAMDAVGRCLSDYRCIRNFDTDLCYRAHVYQKEFLEEVLPADVVMTHHAPSFESINPRYKVGVTPSNYLANYGFASHLDDFVIKSKAKLWVHGHTHDKSDYMIGETRVIAHPCGYPYERNNNVKYVPKYVEV